MKHLHKYLTKRIKSGGRTMLWREDDVSLSPKCHTSYIDCESQHISAISHTLTCPVILTLGGSYRYLPGQTQKVKK